MKRISFVVFLGLMGVLLVGAFYTLSLMQKPLGPALALEGQDGEMIQAQPASIRLPVIPGLPQAQSGKTCGGSGQLALFSLGQASPIEAGLFGADALRLIVVDYDSPGVSILAVPVWLWVDASVLKDPQAPFTSLNLVYQKAYEAAGPGNPPEVRTQKATQALAQAVLDNFGFVPDRYLAVLEEPFVEMVDMLGGIELDLPAAVDGTSEGYGIYPAGPQHLNGLQTLNFTRMLLPGGITTPDIWGRFARQNLVLHAMLEESLKPENWTKLPDLAKESRKAVVTDLSVNQVTSLACMLEVVGDQATLLEVAPEMVSYDDLGHMIPDMEAIQALVAQLTGE